MNFATRCTVGLAWSALVSFTSFAARAAEDPPANPDPTLASDEAKAVTKAVKQNVKIAVDATKEGAQQVADKARDVAHEVAVATKEGAQEVAATAKRGTEKTKAVLSDSKMDPKPTEKADNP